MRTISMLAVLIGVLTISATAAEEKLADYIDGLINSRDIAVGLNHDGEGTLHITSYLSKLKLKQKNQSVPAELHYDLWRHYLDCHHLCQVFYHQTYMLPEDLPIFSMLELAFPGFKAAARAEGGQIWISAGFDFLQKVDPHETARKKASNAESGRR